MQEAGLKGKIYGAIRKMLPLLIGVSLGLAIVDASSRHQSYSNFLYCQSVEEGHHQSPIGVEYGYGIPIPYTVKRVYWNLSAPEQSTFIESVEFELGDLIQGWIELSIIITLSILFYQQVDKWILKVFKKRMNRNASRK
jgi:hypothetical protein